MKLEYALSAIYTLLTQLFKQMRPDLFEKVAKYFPLILVGFGIAFNLVIFFAAGPVLVDNLAEYIWLVVSQVIEGALQGLAAVGLYSAINELAPNSWAGNNVEAVLANRNN